MTCFSRLMVVGALPKLGQISLWVFITRTRKFRWLGPHEEGKHPYVIKSLVTLTIPNSHGSEVSQDILVRLIRQAGIAMAEWIGQN